jgi:hypothetical protein
MANKLNRLLGQSGEGLTGGLLDSFGGISYNRYTLTVEGFRSAISVLHVEGNEPLNQSWHYTFTSTDKATAATKALILICGGSYIKISSEGIELGTQDNVYLKCNVMQKMGPASNHLSAKLNNNNRELEALLKKQVSFNSKGFSA